MMRVWNVLAGLGLVVAIASVGLQAPGPVLASDDEGSGERVIEGPNTDLSNSDVSGVIYHIDGNDQEQIVTILDKDVGVAVKAAVKAPGPLSMIKSKQVCVGRFVTAHGVRIGDALLAAEGFDVDQSTQCHSPASK